MWAKKGVFGKGKVPGDIMCVAFASGGTPYDGTTFVGSADGYILRFMEQATDLQVTAHAHRVPPPPHTHPPSHPASRATRTPTHTPTRPRAGEGAPARLE